MYLYKLQLKILPIFSQNKKKNFYTMRVKLAMDTCSTQPMAI